MMIQNLISFYSYTKYYCYGSWSIFFYSWLDIFSCDLDVIFIGDWYYLRLVQSLVGLFSIMECNYHLVDCPWSTTGSGWGLFGSVDCRNDRWSDGICRCIAIRGPKGQLVLRLLVPMQGDDNKQLGTFRSCCFQDITLSQIYQDWKILLQKDF